MTEPRLMVRLDDVHDQNARKMVEAIDLASTSVMGVSVSALLIACACSALRGNGVAVDFSSESEHNAFGLVATRPEHIAKLREFAASIEMAQARRDGALS